MTNRRAVPLVLACCGIACFAATFAVMREAQRNTSDVARSFTALRVPLLPVGTTAVQATFVPEWTKTYYVGLVFPHDTDEDVLALVQQAEESIAAPGRPVVPFDFRWRVRRGATQVGAGSGLDRPDMGFSSASGRGLGFGEFRASAGYVHEVEVSVNPSFAEFLSAGPTLEIGVASAAATEGAVMGHAFLQALSWPLGLGLTATGLVFWAAAIWTALRQARTA